MSRLIIISGPSGAGKDTILKKALERTDNVYLSISMTTRKPRENDGVMEQNGREYFFVSDEEFLDCVNTGRMLEYAQYCGTYYGTPLDPIRNALSEGKNVILEIEVLGMRQVKEKIPEAVTVFITVPSLGVLEKRLRRRGTYSESDIAKRLEKADRELAAQNEYDRTIINDDLEKAVNEFEEIIKSEE